MARPKRRGAFIGPSLHDDPKFVALGRRGRPGLQAQALLPLFKAVMDDQGRSPADVDWVWGKAASGIGGLTAKALPGVIALYGEALAHDGAWALLYEVDGRPFIQWIDAEGDLEGLRYREPSKYPPPDGWRPDEVVSWQDDPYAKGSKANIEWKRSREREKNGTVDHPSTEGSRNRSASVPVVSRRVEPSRDETSRADVVPGRETPKPPKSSAHALRGSGTVRLADVLASAASRTE